MGWMRPYEQQQVLALYGRRATFRCDQCKTPIWIDQLHVEDPQGGYIKVEENPNVRTTVFMPRRKWAKKTYHQHPCNDLRLGKRPKYQDEMAHKSARSDSRQKEDVNHRETPPTRLRGRKPR